MARHKTKEIGIETRLGVAGEYRYRVMNKDGSPATQWSGPNRNLILPAGIPTTPTSSWWAMTSNNCHVGTGTTPNKVLLDGTFSQTGTTVTRASGTGVFASGNVNDFIKFASGERAKIITFTNTLQVEVDRSQTVAAAALTVYDTSRLVLDTWVKATNVKETETGAQGEVFSSDDGTMRQWTTFNFTLETSPRTYTEVGISQTGTAGSSTLLSRVVLDTPVNVGIDQFLQIRFDVFCTLGNYRTTSPITVAITGWPRPYNISSITPGTASGTAFDILLTEDVSSHYAVGRPIIVAGALPVKTVISSISSTGSDFTVTAAAAHGKSSGDSIVIAGATPSGYNGTWTCAVGTTGSTIVVTSGINPGAGTGGTVRLATPATWFDGTWTIASFPTTATIRVTNNTITVPAGTDGTVKNNLNATAVVCQTGWGTRSNSLNGGSMELIGQKSLLIFPESALKTGLAYGSGPTTTGNIFDSGSISPAAYDQANRSRTCTFTVASGSGNNQTIRQMYMGGIMITFEERQRKDSGFQLQVSYTISWEPDLI